MSLLWSRRLHSMLISKDGLREWPKKMENLKKNTLSEWKHVQQSGGELTVFI